jgi:hypothetical protein
VSNGSPCGAGGYDELIMARTREHVQMLLVMLSSFDDVPLNVVNRHNVVQEANQVPLRHPEWE